MTRHYIWWTTAITIGFLKLHAFSYETTWKIHYENARKYLSVEIKDVEFEEELLKTSAPVAVKAVGAYVVGGNVPIMFLKLEEKLELRDKQSGCDGHLMRNFCIGLTIESTVGNK
ncbi:6179_t:CDS:2 [Entrophospora sp. SA101]|nr:6179_t:CDS:2 [Entrophospora sp. SA101]